MNDLSFAPARPSVAVSLAFGGVTTAFVGATGALPLAASIIGFFVLIITFVTGRVVLRGVALLSFWVAVVIAGVSGADSSALALALTAAIVAWDSAGRATTLGLQLTNTARTGRIEALHAAVTFFVGIATFAVASLFRGFVGGVSATAAAIGLCLGVSLLLAAPDEKKSN